MSKSLALFLSAGLAAVAVAAPPKVIYSEITASPTSTVPGVSGALFDLFDRPYRSPDGTRWIIGAESNGATTEDRVIIVGSGETGTVVIREGITMPGLSEAPGFIDRNLSLLNDGRFAFATNTNLVTTTDDEIVGVFDPSGPTVSVVVREGLAAPASAPAGALIGSNNYIGALLATGDVAYASTGLLGGVPTANNAVLFLGGTHVATKGITAPTGQAGGLSDAWEFFDQDDFYASADGTHTIIQGDLLGATASDDVVVVDGGVVLQEASIVPGSSFTQPIALNGILEIAMSANGDWFARGENADDNDWVVRNGTVIAATGDAVPGGLAGEVYSEVIFDATFFTMTGNAAGHWVIGATTSNPDPLADAVLVYFDGTTSTVVARQGDGADLNGDGIVNDDAFMDVFNNDDQFLTDDGKLYFTADIKDGAGTLLGQAFLVYDLEASVACYPDCNLSGTLTLADFGCFQSKYVLGDLYADCNASGTLTLADFGCFQGKYVLGCP